MIATYLLILSGAYLLCGVVFAVPFVLVGVGRIDPHAAHGGWGFRLLIIPGTTIFWPLLARRWFKGIRNPPEERNAHRRVASSSDSSRRKGVLSDSLNREGERPREPKLLGDSEEIRARADARPPISPLSLTENVLQPTAAGTPHSAFRTPHLP